MIQKSNYTIPETYGIQFEIDYVQIKSHRHRIAYAGNPKGIPVIVMMGVFEDSLKDARWLVANMVNNPDAKKINKISYTDYLNKEIKVMDATAISLAKDRSLPIIIFSILKSSNIIDIVNGNGSYSIINNV